MTSKLTREQLRERAQLKAKNLAGAISQSAFANCRSELEEELQFLQCALACMEDEPVEPIWGAKKYPVSRPVPGANLIVWDETGKFVGYGSAVDTRESGVAIQISDGRRFDSNHDLRWQYALQTAPVGEPVAWTDEEELRDVNVAGIGYLFGIDREANKFSDPRRQIMLYLHAQPAPVVPDEMLCEFYEVDSWPDLVRELVKHVEQLQDSAKRNVKPWEDTFPETLLPVYIEKVKQADEACRAAMFKAGSSPAHSCLRPEQSGVSPAQDGNSPARAPSREHFITLCNEFWNWSEMDLVCAEDRGYELRMEWNGDVFKHPVTHALWRMYQAAPGNSPVIPDGYVMVPKRPTAEMIWAAKYAMPSTVGWQSFKDAYIAMLAAAPQEVKGER